MATDSTECTGLTGRAMHTALQTDETEIYIRVLPTHAQILLIRSHLHITHQNAHICIHQPPTHKSVPPTFVKGFVTIFLPWSHSPCAVF